VFFLDPFEDDEVSRLSLLRLASISSSKLGRKLCNTEGFGPFEGLEDPLLITQDWRMRKSEARIPTATINVRRETRPVLKGFS